jgi:predicted TIM-barrel fold metal-dependent hydrolase
MGPTPGRVRLPASQFGAVDAHHHLWDAASNSYPYLSDGSRDRMHGAPLPRRYLIDQYLKDIAGSDIGGSVHVQCGWNPADPVGETRWLDSLADEHGYPNAIVAHADLSTSDCEAVLEAHCAASPRVRGIRQHVGWHDNPRYRLAARPDLLGDPRWQQGYQLLGKFRLSFDLQAFYGQLQSAAALASKYEDVAMILGNSGMPIDRGPGALADWRDAIARFARVENTYVKIGGFGMVDPRWTVESVKPIFEHLLASFGPKRCMLGSNFPVDRLHRDFSSLWTDYGSLLSELGVAEQAQIRSGTATAVYRLH